MMAKKFLAAAIIALGFGGTAIAQDVLPSSATMREMAGIIYGQYGRIAKGEAPFDAAKVAALYATLTQAAAKAGDSFPATIKGKTSVNSRYAASPKVWDMPNEFNAEVAKLNKTIQDNKGNIATEAGFKTANAAINAACNSCHDTFRLRTN